MSFFVDGMKRSNIGGKGLPNQQLASKTPRFRQNNNVLYKCKRETDVEKLCETMENVTKKLKSSEGCEEGDFSRIEDYVNGLGYLIDGKRKITFDMKTVRTASQIRNHINTMISELDSVRKRMDKMLDNSFENYFKNLDSKQTVKEAVQKRLKQELQKTLKSIDENDVDDDDEYSGSDDE